MPIVIHGIIQRQKTEPMNTVISIFTFLVLTLSLPAAYILTERIPLNNPAFRVLIGLFGVMAVIAICTCILNVVNCTGIELACIALLLSCIIHITFVD